MFKKDKKDKVISDENKILEETDMELNLDDLDQVAGGRYISLSSGPEFGDITDQINNLLGE